MGTPRNFRIFACMAAVMCFFFVFNSSAQNFEAENLTRTASAVGTTVATNQSGASNNAFVYLAGTPAVNDWMEFTLPNITAGTYNIKIYYKAFYNRPICQTKIDGVNLGATCDQYNSAQVNQTMFDLGNTSLSSGNHLLRLVVTGKNGSSSGYILNLDNIVLTQTASAPVINTQPQNQSVNTGSTATFSITASGTGTLSYQWRKNGTNITGATSATYTTPATVTADNGALFSCVVSNSAGSTISSNATLTVISTLPPTITVQPQNRSVSEGQTAAFSITATGTAPLSYQWRKNGTNITGATSATYTTPATANADNGALFSCVVSNSAGSTISSNATLTVIATTLPPTITTQPQNLSVTEGQTAAFTITATGTAPLSYQWRKNGTNITGATTATYTTPATVSADNGALFSCVVSNSAGSIISSNATLTVIAALPPTITAQPQNRSVLEGQTATFSITATGTAPLTYQWRKNETNISGAISATYTTPATSYADNGALFSCMINNTYGAVTSNNATLSVTANPRMRDSLALVAFYNATGGTGWTTRTNWLTTQPLNTWYGVSVTSDRVSSLSFPDNNNLAGSIPSAIGNLTALKALHIYQSPQLHGTIPTEIGNLVALDTLKIVYSAINGPLPATLVNCTSLDELNLGGNSITGSIPTWMNSMTALKNLNLSSNQLSGTIPTTLGSMAALTELYLQDNNLDGTIPSSLGNIAGLHILDLWGNQLTGEVPGALGRLSNLNEIMLEQNLLNNINDSVAQLSGLRYCGLSENRFCNLSSVVTAWANVNDNDWAATQTCPKPEVSITATPLSGTAPLAVSFTAANAGQSAINTWGWSFGDGATGAIQNPAHTYTTGGTYQARLIVSGIGGKDTADVTIQVTALPVITAQPANRTVTETQSATFSITATGTAPLLYQWRKNGVNISGATSVSYVTAATTMADNGARFSCIVSNSAGSITSNEALLTVNPIAAPVIVTQPADQNAGVGRTATFTVTASGIGTLSYQWYRGGNAISGATLAAYTTPILTLEDNGARFSCRVTNTGGSVTSNEALLTVSVEAAPQITTQPLSVRVNAGQAVSLTVAATGSAPLSYQWKRGSVNVGSNSATLTFQTVNLADAGMYYVIVSNAFGTITSAKAMLTVLSAGSRFNSQKMSISGELRDANGNPVGNTTPVNVEMTLRVMNSDVGGAALVVETFRNSTNQGVSVDKGLFTVRLGEGTTEDNLQAVMAENPNLWVEIILEGTTPDTLRPRTPLTANGQSLVSNGTQPMHGNGAPGAQTVAVTGTLYIDDASGVTWIKINTGWRRLE